MSHCISQCAKHTSLK